MSYLKLFELTVIVVIIIDISGIVTDFKKMLGRILGIQNVSIKIIECSFCMNFWVSIGYLLITNELSITAVMVTLLLSTLTTIIKDAIYLLRDSIGKIINKIYNI